MAGCSEDFLDNLNKDGYFKYISVLYRIGGPYWKNILSRSQKRSEPEGRGTFLRPLLRVHIQSRLRLAKLQENQRIITINMIYLKTKVEI